MHIFFHEPKICRFGCSSPESSTRDFMWLLTVLAPLAHVPCRRGTMLVAMSQTTENGRKTTVSLKTGAKRGGLCIRAGWELVAPSGSQCCSLTPWPRTKLPYKQQLHHVERLDEPDHAGSIFLGCLLRACPSTLIAAQSCLMLLPHLCRHRPGTGTPVLPRDGYCHASSVGGQCPGIKPCRRIVRAKAVTVKLMAWGPFCKYCYSAT